MIRAWIFLMIKRDLTTGAHAPAIGPIQVALLVSDTEVKALVKEISLPVVMSVVAIETAMIESGEIGHLGDTTGTTGHQGDITRAVARLGDIVETDTHPGDGTSVKRKVKMYI